MARMLDEVSVTAVCARNVVLADVTGVRSRPDPFVTDRKRRCPLEEQAVVTALRDFAEAARPVRTTCGGPRPERSSPPYHV